MRSWPPARSRSEPTGASARSAEHDNEAHRLRAKRSRLFYLPLPAAAPARAAAPVFAAAFDGFWLLTPFVVLP